MDEPTGGLDVSVQARLLDLIRSLVARLGVAVVLVTHDIAVARLLGPSHRGDAARARGGNGVDRPGAGRSAASLYAIAGQFGVAGMMDPISSRGAKSLSPQGAKPLSLRGAKRRGNLDVPTDGDCLAALAMTGAVLVRVTGMRGETQVTTPLLQTEGLTKSFTLHLRGGLRLPVLGGVDLSVEAGQCVVLSGSLRRGKIDAAALAVWQLPSRLRKNPGVIRRDGRHRPRRTTHDPGGPSSHHGYVSQFLRVVPRVPALDIVAEALLGRGPSPDEARDRRPRPCCCR
jgi:hypothetical protein